MMKHLAVIVALFVSATAAMAQVYSNPTGTSQGNLITPGQLPGFTGDCAVPPASNVLTCTKVNGANYGTGVLAALGQAVNTSNGLPTVTNPAFLGTVSLGGVASQTFYSDFGAPQPSILNMGDRQFGGYAIGLTHSSTLGGGASTWGTNYAVDYLLRDAHLGIGQTKGGYGVVAVGRASDYSNNPTNYKVTTGFGCFQLADATATISAYAECGYDEVGRSVVNASAIGREIAIDNWAGYPPTINPYQVNNLGFTTGIQIDPGGGSAGNAIDYYPGSSAFSMPNFSGQVLRGLIFGHQTIAGTNGAADATTTISCTSGSSVATVISQTGIVAGQAISATCVPGGNIVLAVWSGGRIKMSANASATTAVAVTFQNVGGIAVDMACGSKGQGINWTDDAASTRAAFIRCDTPTSARSLGIIFSNAGVLFVDPVTEGNKAWIDTSGSVYGTRFSATGGPPTLSACGTSPPAPVAPSTVMGGTFTTGTTAAACTLTWSPAWPTDSFCTFTAGNAAAAAVMGAGYVSAHSATAVTYTFSAAVTTGIVNYTCSGR